MLKERIQEIFEFTKSESPYRKANKGWIFKDIFLVLSPSSYTLSQQNETAKVTLLWSPINSLLSNIFLILIIGSILVFTSLSFVKGRFDFNLFSNYLINDLVKTEDNNVLERSTPKPFYSLNSNIENKLDINDLNQLNSLDDNHFNSDQEEITNEIDSEEVGEKEIESNSDVEIVKSKQSKSNFI